MRFLRLENPYLFPSFYMPKKEESKGFCSYRGCVNKIRMKRQNTLIRNRQEAFKSPFDQKRNLLQDDGENTRENISRAVSLLI